MNPVLIFDMDGVIADSWEVCYPCCKNFMVALNQPQLCSQEAILRLFEDNFMASLTRIVDPANIQSAHLLQLARGMNEAMNIASCFSGIKPALETLSKDHSLYLVTANFTLAAQTFLNNHQLNYFIEVLGSDQSFNKVEKIRSITKQHPDSPAYYIGDTLGDMIEGKAAGVQTVAAGWGWHDAPTLLKGNPDYFINQPEKLLTFMKS
nr:HAD hydrolase-like protein [Endozoicomonas sp.]